MKILIVDDHPVLREGIAALLTRSAPETIVLQAGDARDGLGLIAAHTDLDVVLLDLVLPGMGGLSAITEFGRACATLPVIVLASSEDHQIARRALAQGALGYVPKSASPTSLLSAIQMVMNGDVYVPPFILDAPAAACLSRNAKGSEPAWPSLTDRQIEVLQRLGRGQSNRAIATALDLSEKTVKAHVTAVFKALNVVSRTQAAAVARDRGFI